MITPGQKINLHKKREYVSRELNYPYADFRNSGILSAGCITYGRWNGYFYIDYDRKVKH